MLKKEFYEYRYGLHAVGHTMLCPSLKDHLKQSVSKLVSPDLTKHFIPLIESVDSNGYGTCDFSLIEQTVNYMGLISGFMYGVDCREDMETLIDTSWELVKSVRDTVISNPGLIPPDAHAMFVELSNKEVLRENFIKRFVDYFVEDKIRILMNKIAQFDDSPEGGVTSFAMTKFHRTKLTKFLIESLENGEFFSRNYTESTLLIDRDGGVCVVSDTGSYSTDPEIIKPVDDNQWYDYNRGYDYEETWPDEVG